MGTTKPSTIPAHIQGLLAFLSRPEEKANEDLAISYFRKIYGDDFTRQKEAQQADGYVPGVFVLELKGKSTDWLAGLFQGLAYKNEGLDFSQIVVAAKNFLALWQVKDLDVTLREEVLAADGPPSRIGVAFARKFSAHRADLLNLATWTGAELTGNLFVSNPQVVLQSITTFEKSLRSGTKVRSRITPSNFTSTLKEMKSFFDPLQPVKAVRAFYSMVYSWSETSTVRLSNRAPDQATLDGELITNLVGAQRSKFKDFVENRYIYLGQRDCIDDFFSRYDEALDAVDRGFRVSHGIFFTNPYLAKFALWFVRQHVPELGKDYLVIDPACGSGNLVTNWRSPMELRHKVVSEIEPELIFAVEQRMKGDQWHNGKFTVVPKVSENAGLNFLTCSAEEYLQKLRTYLVEKGHKPDKPLAILCNPPYRSDDDQSASNIGYSIHESISKMIGNDADRERYCCFLAQMKMVCEAARSSGLPNDSLLLLFTKSAWLTKRSMFAQIRSAMLGSFEDVAGLLVNGEEFFDVKGRWPVAFTIWRYKGQNAALNSQRSISLLDLTWLKRTELTSISWENLNTADEQCRNIIECDQAKQVQIGSDRASIRLWCAQTMLDFKRDRRKSEVNQTQVGGLPAGDPRQGNKKAYGETHGAFIGFLDDLTPCRVKSSVPNKPWFRLNSQFMDVKKNRCFSGPPSHWGFCATNLPAAKKLFLWYAMARTFLQHPYPMWVDADDMWGPFVPPMYECEVVQAAFAIAFAENECVAARFPANNPIVGVPELTASNPLTPLNGGSFWMTEMLPYCARATKSTSLLIENVDALFRNWGALFKNKSELPFPRRTYLLDDGGLTREAGIVQIRDYAKEVRDTNLLAKLSSIQTHLKDVKTELFNALTSAEIVNYFGSVKKTAGSERNTNNDLRTKIEA